MNLAIFLASGGSFEEMAKMGQKDRFIRFYLNYYSKNYEKIFVFTYKDEEVSNLPKNVVIVSNKYSLNRYIYGLLIPFLNYGILRKVNVIRVFHLYGCIPAIIAKIFLNKKFVVNFAFDYTKDAALDKKYIQMWLYKILKPLAVLLSSKIIAANTKIYNNLPKSKVLYLPNGVDTSVFKPTKAKKREKPIILSVGRLEKVKNYGSLIKALMGIKCKLILVGNGSLRANLENLAKKNKVDLEIIDSVNNSSLPQLYNNADIFVLCSLNEGHPKVLLEAMACSKCCIGTNVEGINELIRNEETGLLSDISVNSLKKQILIALKNEGLRNKLGKNAREFIKEKYELNTLLQKEVDALNSV